MTETAGTDGAESVTSRDRDDAEPDYRRELYGTALLIAVGSALVLWLAGRTWVTAKVDRQPPFGPLSLGVSGRHIDAALTGLAVVGLLAAVLILITGRLVRRLLSLLVAGVGGWILLYAIRFLSGSSGYRNRDLIGDRAGLGAQAQSLARHPAWAAASAVCAVLIVAGAALVLVRSGRWPGGLSRRYAAPAEAAEAGDPWRQLDRGEDPTIDNG